MTQLYLERTVSDDNGTFGTLTMENDAHGVQQLCLTCELPWKDNEPEVSCIPTGIYNCIAHDSLKFPNTWMLMGIPGRHEILIHTGNTIKDTHGCILVGDKFGMVNGLPAVMDSRETMGMLRTVLPQTFRITIS